MSKTITIRTDHEYESKGRKTTVQEALDWIEKHTSDVDEETGEDSGPAYTPGDLICYAVNRMKALHKDGKRYKKGILAERRYAPRVDQVENKPRKLAALVEEVHATAPAKPKPEKRPAKPRKPKKAKAPKVAPDAGNPEVAASL